MAEKNLADAFGMTGEAPGIQGLARRADADPEVDFSDVEEPDDIEQEAPIRSEEDSDDTDFSPENSDNIDAFPVGVYLLPDVIRNISRLRRRTGKQNAEIAMDAIDNAHRRGRLGKLVLKRAQGPKRPSNSLFPSRQRYSGGRVAQPGRKLWTFQATKAEKLVLERLMDEHQAASVSELVSVAVEALHAPKQTRTPSAPDS